MHFHINENTFFPEVLFKILFNSFQPFLPFPNILPINLISSKRKLLRLLMGVIKLRRQAKLPLFLYALLARSDISESGLIEIYSVKNILNAS